MQTQDESEAITTLTGFSLNNVLADLSLPTGSGLTTTLGLSSLPTLDPSQIYNNRWEDDGAVGADEGEDFEDEVDRELQQEKTETRGLDMDEDDDGIKIEVHSPVAIQPRERRVRVVKRLVERPKSVYERFPAFERNKILDFTELFKGYTANKSRVVKRPLLGECVLLFHPVDRGVQRAETCSRECVHTKEGTAEGLLRCGCR